MKKFLSMALAFMLAFPVVAFAQGALKIGTVDMQRAFKECNKTKDAEAKINDAKNAAKKEYDDKIANIKNMEREINEFRQTRERQLQEQAMRMREGIVKEITDIVMEKVKANNMDLVFDKSGMSLNGVPVLMYSHDNVDFTNDIITVLNKPGRATATSTEKTSASPPATPARASKP